MQSLNRGLTIKVNEKLIGPLTDGPSATASGRNYPLDFDVASKGHVAPVPARATGYGRGNVSYRRICANRPGLWAAVAVLRPDRPAAAGADRSADRVPLLQHAAVAAAQQHSGAQGTRPVAGADRPAPGK